MDIFELDMEEIFLPCQKDNKIEIFLADCILTKFEKKQQKETSTWLELLEIQKIQKVRWEYFFSFNELEKKEEGKLESKYQHKTFVEREPSYYGYTDKNGKFIDRFEIARRKRKAKQRIFDRITWGIFFLGLVLTFCFIFFWKITFIEHIIYFTSMWIDVYIIMLINYFKLKDLPRPFVCNQRTL